MKITKYMGPNQLIHPALISLTPTDLCVIYRVFFQCFTAMKYKKKKIWKRKTND